MGKILEGGSAGPDDPIYTGGIELFTHGRFRPSLGEPPAPQNLAPEPEPPQPPTRLKAGEVEVSVEWYDTQTMVLDRGRWEAIKLGEKAWLETLQDDDEIEWRWRFNHCGPGLLVLDCGDDSALECHRQISELPVRVGPSP